MVIRRSDVSLSYDELEALCAERETTLHTLRQQIRQLEREHDEAQSGLHQLEQALRRRGCCDGHDIAP